MHRLKWFTWIGLIAAGTASWGLVWLAISSQLAKYGNRAAWLTSGSSIRARILGWVAAVFLAAITSDWLMRLSRRNP